MSNRNKSLFRGPNTKHYTLVHRSVRDPALNEDASERVLAEVQRNKGRTRQDLEGLLEQSGGLDGIRANEGEAAAFGVYFDDTEYDYMKHLRPVGQAVDAHLVEAPRRQDVKGKGKAKLSAVLREEEGKRAQVDQQTTYREYLEQTFQEGGLQPDMDPALREILEALEDDAYIADGGEQGGASSASNDDDFFASLVDGSAKGDYRETPFEDEDWQDEEEVPTGLDLGPDSAYAKEVLKFKTPKAAHDSDDEYDEEAEDYEASEGGDTIAALQAASARRPPRAGLGSDKRSMASASAFSMSSSAMFRNEGLQTLDDRFDQIEQMYGDDSDSDEGGSEEEMPAMRQAQLEDAMDEFLQKYEVHGGKMRATLGDSSTTAVEKLAAIRGQFEKMNVLEHVRRQEREERLTRLARKKGDKTLDDELWEMVRDIDEYDTKWDCESILSTYSNLENHPRVIRLAAKVNGDRKGPQSKSKADAKITIDPRTGFPVVVPTTESQLQSTNSDQSDSGDDSDATMDADEVNANSKRQTVTRPREEAPADKKARKAQVKAEKQARRTEKKATKDAFGAERKRQMNVKKGKLKDAADVSKGNSRNIEVMSLS